MAKDKISKAKIISIVREQLKIYIKYDKYSKMKTNQRISIFLIVNLMLLGLANPATAQKRQSTGKSGNFGLPTHRRDGGSRGPAESCVANLNNQSLMALIPQKTVGISASTSPKLFFYVPEVARKKTLEFVLRNESDELMYEAFVSTEGNGIMSIEIPADVNANLLKTDENYHWYLSMICDYEQRSRDIVVEGWLRRENIDVATQKQLDTVSLVEKAEVYRDRGFWFDALSALAESPSLTTGEHSVHQKWSEMLSSVGLEELASKPFVETELVPNPAESF